MKLSKLLALSLIITMLSGSMAFATDTTTTIAPPTRVVTYSLDDVIKLVRANASIKDNYQLQKDILNTNIQQVGDNLDALDDSKNGENNYKKLMDEAEKDMDEATPGTPEWRDAYNRFQEYEVQYELSKTMAAISYGGDVDAAEKDLNTTFDTLVANRQDVNRMMEDLPIDLELAATYIYLNILELLDTSALLDANLNLLENNKHIVELQKEMGMVTNQSLEQVTLSINQVVASKNTINAAVDTMKRLLNNLMGNPLDMNFNLADYSVSVEKIPTPIITEETIQAALENNLTYKQKERTYNTARKNLRDENPNGGSSDDVNIQTLSNEATQARLDMESEEVNVRNTLTNKRNNIIAAANAYTTALIAHEDAQKSLNFSQIRYDLGLISRMQLQSEQTTAMDKANALTSATNDYYFALKDFDLYVDGTVTGLYDSLRGSM